jgi:hypothetical protein
MYDPSLYPLNNQLIDRSYSNIISKDLNLYTLTLAFHLLPLGPKVGQK